MNNPAHSYSQAILAAPPRAFKEYPRACVLPVAGDLYREGRLSLERPESPAGFHFCEAHRRWWCAEVPCTACQSRRSLAAEMQEAGAAFLGKLQGLDQRLRELERLLGKTDREGSPGDASHALQ